MPLIVLAVTRSAVPINRSDSTRKILKSHIQALARELVWDVEGKGASLESEQKE